MGILPRICLATRGTSYKKPQPTPKKKKKPTKNKPNQLSKKPLNWKKGGKMENMEKSTLQG